MSFPTPPETTLSTPSPTERSFLDQEPNEDSSKMTPPIPHPPLLKPIYLIVATAVSPPMGIGFKGSLPWSSIRSDMSFFRKVTTESRSLSITSPPLESNARTPINAVIMGRKTWESIPLKFRPLAGRINIIITRRDPNQLGSQISSELQTKGWKTSQDTFSNTRDSQDIEQPETAVSIESESSSSKSTPSSPPPILISTSIESTISLLSQPASSPSARTSSTPSNLPFLSKYNIDNIFTIGGAEIYNLILSNPITRPNTKILQTQIRRSDSSDFECDTFFPVKLGTEEGEWREVPSRTVVKDWTGGIELPQQQDKNESGDAENWVRDEQADVEIRVVGWELR